MLLSEMKVVDVKFFGHYFPGAPNEPETTFVSDGGEHVLGVGGDGNVVSIENLIKVLTAEGFRFAEVTNKPQVTRSAVKTDDTQQPVRDAKPRNVGIIRFTRDGRGFFTKGGRACPEFPRENFDALHVWLNGNGVCTINGAHWTLKAATHEISVNDGVVGLKEIPLGIVERA